MIKMDKDDIENIIKLFVDKYDFSGGVELASTFIDEYSGNKWSFKIKKE